MSKKEKDAVGSANPTVGHLPVSYPTPEDGLHSAGHILNAAMGITTLSKNMYIAHTWVGASAALGKIFPPDGLMESASPAFSATLTEEEKACVEEYKTMMASASNEEMQAIDWNRAKVVLKMFLEILLKFV